MFTKPPPLIVKLLTPVTQAKHILEIQERFFDPERELYEFLQSDLSRV